MKQQFTLEIDRSLCIKCGRCVKVCPSLIFRQDARESEVRIEHPENCIVCGHCVAVCPTDAVIHSSFPEDKVHRIDRKSIPDPEQLMLLMRSRRSNRAFSKKPVPEDTIERILEAAHRAPTASNMQQVSFTVVTDPEKLYKISEYTLGIFSGIAKRLNNPLLKPILKMIFPDLYKMIPRLKAMGEAFRNGYDPVLRGATGVIFIHTPNANRFGNEDSNLAYQNASLMAEASGITQFYTGFVCMALRQDKKNGLNSLLGIEGKIHAGMAIGIPEFLYPKYIDKKEIQVKKL